MACDIFRHFLQWLRFSSVKRWSPLPLAGVARVIAALKDLSGRLDLRRKLDTRTSSRMLRQLSKLEPIPEKSDKYTE
ncbi:hypothetical protein PIB30_042028 [Stylosanthes scabra]|uniref:Uncharacterized protein n=1 Tax=Stylosanthes scabra TaxID=79078 RepID=A0ABU6UHS1_9FABA|nr:hypothetical protein [Stylosanthes scabra]